MGIVKVCSDIHGDWNKYNGAVNSLGSDDILYIIGDATDRGPYGIKILEDIQKRKQQGNGPKVEYILGNHDIMLLDHLKTIIKLQLHNVNSEQINKEWIAKVFPNVPLNHGFKTIEDVLSMSEQEQLQLQNFLENSYVQVVLGNPNAKVGCPNKFVITHSIPPINKPYSFTYKQAISKNVCRMDERWKDINNKEEACRAIKKCTWARVLQENENKFKPEVQWKNWFDHGYCTICGHTPDKLEASIQYYRQYLVLDIDTSVSNKLALLCLNDGSIQAITGQSEINSDYPNACDVARIDIDKYSINTTRKPKEQPIKRYIWKGNSINDLTVRKYEGKTTQMPNKAITPPKIASYTTYTGTAKQLAWGLFNNDRKSIISEILLEIDKIPADDPNRGKLQAAVGKVTLSVYKEMSDRTKALDKSDMMDAFMKAIKTNEEFRDTLLSIVKD